MPGTRSEGYQEPVPSQEQPMKPEKLHLINCECHGCMDGRPVLFKAQKVDGVWNMVVEPKVAAEVVEARLPGGALGFIAVLEKVGNLSQDEAIELAEKTLRDLRMQPQFHIDNDHGNFEIQGKSDKELFAFLDTQVEGCGFAKLIWGEEAPTLLKKLIERGWLVEVLGGHHAENRALAINQENKAINTAEATADSNQAFTFNRPETERVLSSMGRDVGFVSRGMTWFDQQFAAIAEKIGNIHNVTQI